MLTVTVPVPEVMASMPIDEPPPTWIADPVLVTAMFPAFLAPSMVAEMPVWNAVADEPMLAAALVMVIPALEPVALPEASA